MNYTAEMERAMQQSHGMGFAEYSQKLDNRLAVEQRREKEYARSQKMLMNLASNKPL